MKRLGIVLGLLMLASLGQATSCDVNIDSAYKEFKLVCAETPEDLNRTVNAVKLTNDNWRLLGAVSITKSGPGPNQFLYCQTLYRYF
jgi:hypothetical protein